MNGGRTRSFGRIRWLPIVGFLLYGLYYYFSNQQEVPMTGRSQLVDISREQEMALGYQSYQQILMQENVLQAGEAVDLVRATGQRLAAVAEDPGFEWEFNVISSEEANAFCLPGGKVGIYTGILPITKDEAGLATVIGHEVAHAIARHGAERISEAMLIQTGGGLLGANSRTVGSRNPRRTRSD